MNNTHGDVQLISAAVKARKASVNLKIVTAMAAAGDKSNDIKKIEACLEELSLNVMNLADHAQLAGLDWVTAK